MTSFTIIFLLCIVAMLLKIDNDIMKNFDGLKDLLKKLLRPNREDKK